MRLGSFLTPLPKPDPEAPCSDTAPGAMPLSLSLSQEPAAGSGQALKGSTGL